MILVASISNAWNFSVRHNEPDRVIVNKKTDKYKTLAAQGQRLFSALLLLSSTSLSPAMAGPTGGQVVGGTGSIAHSGTTTTVNQTTQNMAIDWQSYNVNVNERVQYTQPNSSSISLNRILSQNGSTIAGRIDANGQVILVNPNGIFFTPTSIINVGGIIASGLNIQLGDFMNGNYIFDAVLGTAGTVLNGGMINASLGGNVALIGKQVENAGLIVANLGSVSLAAGKQAVLTFDQGGLLGVRVSKEILQEELGVDPAVLNGGEINAEGGRVLLTASTSQDVFSQAVNTGDLNQGLSVVVHEDGSFTLGSGADVINTGTIDTSTTSSDQNIGRIVLIGENVTSSGELRADATSGDGGEIELHAQSTALLTENSVISARSETNGQGGTVKVLGDNVGLFDHSIVDASGASGGGEVLIGGDQEGKNPLIPNAEFIYLSEESQVFADALDNGDGGRLITFASDTARIYGDLSARGGLNGGDGGFIETSGLIGFQITGTPDASSFQGEAGTWLIDPYNIIVTNNNSNVTIASDDAFISNGDGDAEINVLTIQTALGSTNVIIRTGGDSGPGNGDITFDRNGDLDYDGSGTTRTLTLDAAGDIIFGAGSRIFDRTTSGQDSLNVALLVGGAVILQGASGGQAAASITTQGGTFTVGTETTPVISFTNNGTVDTSGEFNQDGGDISIYTSGPLSSTGLNATGGNTGTSNNSATDRAGRGGGNVILGAASISISGAINTVGSAGTYDTNGPNDNGQRGGNGGLVSITALTGNVSVNAITTSGGAAAGDYTGGATDTGDGGDAGTITLTAGASSTINLDGDLTAMGARGYIEGNDGSHGAGDSIDLNGDVVLVSDVVIDAAGATDTTVNIPGSYGDIMFGGGIAGTTDRAENLTVTGNAITFSGAVADATTRLGDMVVDARGAINANAIAANTFTVNQATRFTSGTIDTANAGSTGGNISITAEQITLNDDLDASGSTDGTVNLALSAAGSVTLMRTTDFTSPVILTGSAGIDTFNAANRPNNWVLTPTASTLNTDLTFFGIEILVGNVQDDRFTLPDSGIFTGTLYGGGTNDELQAGNRLNAWDITDTGTGTVTGLNGTFNEIESLIGGNAIDTFEFTGGSITGTADGRAGDDIFILTQTITQGQLDGGADNDTFRINANVSGNSQLRGGTGNDRFDIADGVSVTTTLVSGIAVLGGADNDTLDLADVGQDLNWSITASTGGGNVTDTAPTPVTIAAFDEMENLIGSDIHIDTFQFDTGGLLSGNINAGGGADVINFNGGTLTGTAYGEAGTDFFNINTTSLTVSLDGGNDADNVRGPDATNTWQVTADDDGTLNNTIAFSQMETLTGGTGTEVDTFTVDSGFSIDTLNGQDGDDQFTINGTVTTLNGSAGIDTITVTGTDSSNLASVDTLNGGAGNDIININANGRVMLALNGDAGENEITVNATDTTNYGEVATIIGGVDADTIIINTNGRVTGAITSNDGGDTITVNGTANTVNAGAGNDTLSIADASSVAELIDGGADIDELTITGNDVILTVGSDVDRVETLKATGSGTNTLITTTSGPSAQPPPCFTTSTPP